MARGDTTGAGPSAFRGAAFAAGFRAGAFTVRRFAAFATFFFALVRFLAINTSSGTP